MLIAHPDEKLAEKLEQVIGEDPRVAVVGRATTGKDCVEKTAQSWPTVVVMDTTFSDMPAAKCIQKLSETRVPLAVLICSTHAQKGEKQLEAALTAGAYNFILLPEDPAGIDTIGRQILTTIHVTGFSKTKNIPQADPKSTAGVGNAGGFASLNCMLIDCAPQHITSLGWVMCRLNPRGEPAMIVILRKKDGSAELLSTFGPKLHTKAETYRDGMALKPGTIVVLDDAAVTAAVDLVAGKDEQDRVTLKQVKSDGSRRAPGINPVRLATTLADLWGQTFAVMMFGKPTADSAEALIQAKEKGAFTMAYEHSEDLLADVTRRFPQNEVPDDLVTLEQVDSFMNAVLR